MASNYPSGLDSFTNPAGTDNLAAGIGHAAQHANANDAIEAIEGELGTDPAGASATVKARFGVIEANDWVTTDRIADSQVTSAKILDGTITGTDIASGTVTSTNILDGTVVNGDINAAAAIAATKVAGTAVTQADTGTVTSAMLLNGTIVDADVNASADIAKTKIAGTAVTVADTGTVTSTMILDGTIVNGDINASAAIAATKISGTAVTQGDTGTVTSTMIADATIVGGDIATGTVTSTNLADSTIVNADVNSAAAIDVSKLSGVTPSATVGNLLTANQASIETGTAGGNGMIDGLYPASCTIAHSTSQHLVGTGSLEATASDTAFYIGALPPISTGTVPITPGQTVTGMFSVKSTGAVANFQVRLRFLDSGGTMISDVGDVVAPSTSSWTGRMRTAVAPAGAAYVWLYCYASSATVSSVHYFDCLSLHLGAGGDWALPGTPITNLGFYTDESVGRRLFQWDANNARWQQTFGDTGWRDVTGSLESGATAVAWRMRRVNNTVSHQIYNAAHSGAAIYTLPAGFNCLGTSGSSVPISKADGTVGAFLMDGASGCSLQPVGMESYTSALYVVSYTTTEAWPSSLPGAPLGSIPA